MLCPFLLSNKKITLLQYTLNISQKAASIRNSVNVRRVIPPHYASVCYSNDTLT